MTENNDKTRANVAYLGALNLLRWLADRGKITEEERAGAAGRVAENLGTNLITAHV